MKIYVWKHPSPDTLERVVRLDDAAQPPGDPYELMTPEGHNAWRTAELDAGWTPQPVEAPPERYKIPRDTLYNRFVALFGEETAAAFILSLPDPARVSWFSNAWFWSDNDRLRTALADAGCNTEQINALMAPE